LPKPDYLGCISVADSADLTPITLT